MIGYKALLEIDLNRDTNMLWFYFERRGLRGIRHQTDVESDWEQDQREHFEQRLTNLFEEAFAARESGDADVINQTIASIGQDVWDILPQEFQTAVQQFDRLALDEQVRAGRSQPVLIVKTNVRCVPWDLCVVPPGPETETDADVDHSRFERPICSRYHLAIAHTGFGEPVAVAPAQRQRILLIRELPPGEEARHYPNVSPDYPNLLKRLDEVVEIIKAEGVQVDEDYVGKRKFVLEDKLKGRFSFEKQIREQYDMIVFMGHYVPGTGQDGLGQMELRSVTDPDRYVDLANIQVGSHPQPALFLNACHTDRGVRPRFIHDSSDCQVWSLPEIFIRKGASVFVGTRQDVEPDVAACFASAFLEAVFVNGASLVRAMSDGREVVKGHFSCSGFKKLETVFFSLHGNAANLDALTNSFRFGKQPRPLQLIYAPIVKRYLEPIGRSIFPDGDAAIEHKVAANFDEVVKLAQESRDLFMADMPLLSAAHLISEGSALETEDPFVIIGALLRVDRDYTDAYLFYIDDPARLGRSILLHSGYHSQVTAFAMRYWKEKGLMEHFAQAHLTDSYGDILEGMKRLLEARNLDCLPPFILASDFARNFNEFFDGEIAANSTCVSKTEIEDCYEIEDRHGAKRRMVRVNLAKSFFSTCQEQGVYAALESVPAEALVTRTSQVERNRFLYRDLLTRWADWKTDFLMRQLQLEQRRNVVVRFRDSDRQAMELFTKYVASEMLGYLQIQPLCETDFETLFPWDVGLPVSDQLVPSAAIPDEVLTLLNAAQDELLVSLRQKATSLNKKSRRKALRQDPDHKEFEQFAQDSRDAVEEFERQLKELRNAVTGMDEGGTKTLVGALEDLIARMKSKLEELSRL